MRTASRRVAAAILPLAVVGLTPAVAAPMAPDAPINPERGAQVVRDDYTGHVQVVRGRAADQGVLRGSVFVDRDRDSVRDAHERGLAGVTVSNGRDVVTTNGRGEYALPAFDRMTVFVTQPSGFAVPVDEDNIAQFSYNHFPSGSPALKFGGVAPTGPLPKAVNFPVVRSKATAASNQSCAVASDTQTYNDDQVGYARQGAVRELVRRDDLGGCGVLLLGDNVGDDLSFNDDIKDLYRQVKGPVRALPGNHDMDFDAVDDEHSLDTHRNDFGPAYFSYDVGQAHVVALDNIKYKGAVPGKKSGGYWEYVDEAQLEWLRKDLASVPANRLLVLAAHSPIVHYRGVATDNAVALFETLRAAGRTAENTVILGGHTHTLENLLPGTSRTEWADQGIPTLPYHQIVAGAVSGDWYSGSLDEHGLPNAYGIDGLRPGSLTMSLRGNEYVESYKIRNEPWRHRLSLGVNTPAWRAWAEQALAWRTSKDPAKGPIPAFRPLNVVTEDDLAKGTFITSNLYLGSTDATVEVSIDGRAPRLATHTQPGAGEATAMGWEYSDVPAATANLRSTGNVTRSSSSLWRAPLPTSLSRGTHTAAVRATDRHGRVYTDTVRFVVVETPDGQ